MMNTFWHSGDFPKLILFDSHLVSWQHPIYVPITGDSIKWLPMEQAIQIMSLMLFLGTNSMKLKIQAASEDIDCNYTTTLHGKCMILNWPMILNSPGSRVVSKC